MSEKIPSRGEQMVENDKSITNAPSDIIEAQSTHPFKGSLESAGLGVSRRLMELKDAPDKLIREFPLSDIKNKENTPDRIEEIKKGMRIFNILQDQYGISVARTDLVLGGTKENPIMYMVTDKIEASGEKGRKIPLEAVEKADKFFTGIVSYYSDVYKNGGDYWWDFHFGQIIYGHKVGSGSDQFYIVDIDPMVKNYDKNNENNHQNFFLFKMFNRLEFDMRHIERQFPTPIKLEKSRSLLNNILKTLPKTKLNYEDFVPDEIKGKK